MIRPSFLGLCSSRLIHLIRCCCYDVHDEPDDGKRPRKIRKSLMNRLKNRKSLKSRPKILLKTRKSLKNHGAVDRLLRQRWPLRPPKQLKVQW